MSNLFEISEGDLFMATADQAYEVYRLIKSPDDKGNALARCVLWRTAEGTWTPASRDGDEKWNGYASVRKVGVSIDVD